MFEDAGGELAQDKAAPFFGGSFDAAIAEEGVELFCEFIEIIGESIGEKIAGNALQDLSKAAKMDAEGIP